jgi:hypothetical protein
MAFKLTYTDGQETDYDDDTAWTVEDGVLKLGRADGDWSVLVSPSHWAVLELVTAAPEQDESAQEEAEKDKEGDD